MAFTDVSVGEKVPVPVDVHVSVVTFTTNGFNTTVEFADGIDGIIVSLPADK